MYLVHTFYLMHQSLFLGIYYYVSYVLYVKQQVHDAFI